MRDPAHESNPNDERGEAAKRGNGGCHDEHCDGTGKTGGHQRAGPQAGVRRRPREDGRQEPSHDDQQVSEPAGHDAPPRALALPGERDEGEQREDDGVGDSRFERYREP